MLTGKCKTGKLYYIINKIELSYMDRVYIWNYGKQHPTFKNYLGFIVYWKMFIQDLKLDEKYIIMLTNILRKNITHS